MVGPADESEAARVDQGRRAVAAPGVPLPTVAAIVEAGRQAPSGDNCQPWRFLWDGEQVRIAFDAERASSLYDVREAASWISLGAVLANMRVAACHLGCRLTVRLFPVGEPANIVADVGLDPGPASADRLFPAIAARCVNRGPYAREPLPSTVRAELCGLAREGGADLAWVEDDRIRARVAALAAQNDRILFENRALHDGLYRWLRWTPAEVARSHDGMPIETLGLRRLERPGFRLLGSWRCARLLARLGLTRLLPSRAGGLYRRSAAIALLTVPGGAREDLVRGGEALEHIWLAATLRGVALQPITGITFLLLRLALTGGEGLSHAHRSLLTRIDRQFREVFAVGGSTPVMLFRLGLAPPPSARAPRRPLADVFTSEAAPTSPPGSPSGRGPQPLLRCENPGSWPQLAVGPPPDILFVEDDDKVRSLYAEMLHAAGFSVRAMKLAETALEDLDRTRPDLIILDLGMPAGEMSGMELLARLRENPAWVRIPVVILSGLGDMVNPDVTARLGVRRVVAKTAGAFEELTRTLSEILRPDPDREPAR